MLGLADDTYYSQTAVDKLDWKLFEALLARMDTSSHAFGATLYVGLHPAIGEVWEPFIADTIRRTGIPPETYDRHALDRKVSQIAQRRDIRFVPQIEEFQKRAAEGPFHLLPKDQHSNGVGYGITADVFAARIAAENGNR